MALMLSGVTFKIDRATLLRNVSLTVEPGKLTALLGPNGAGKSTALNVLTGDLRPSSGRALLDGRDVHRIPLRERAARRAVVRQHAPLDFPLCVYEVVALARYPYFEAEDQNGADVEAAMAAVDVLAFAARDYATLSGGERQKVQIARALAQIQPHNGGERGYLLMDEPTAHLDLKQQIIAIEAARRFADAGGGVLCILHDIALANEFSDRAALMCTGEILAQGPSQSVFTASNIASAFGLGDKRSRRLVQRWD